MKNFSTLILLLVCFTACHQSNSNPENSKTDSIEVAKLKNPNHLKSVREYEEMFLDGGTDKVLDLIGTPDMKQESPNRVNGYYIYYEKVWDEGRTKHLVIAYRDDKVARIKAAIFGERIALPGGDIRVERPTGYQSEGTNGSDEMTKIEKLYNSIDTIHTTAFIDGDESGFYRTYRVGNLTLFKQIHPGQGDASFTEYLFVDGKVRFKYYYDQQKWFVPEKVYISYNGNVLKYLKGDKDTPCDKNEYCKYDDLSTPYFLLKEHGSN